MRKDFKRFLDFLNEYEQIQHFFGNKINKEYTYINYENKLSDNDEIIKTIKEQLNKNEKALMIAPTNSGKTFTLINKVFKEYDDCINIICIPTKTQTEQVEEAYNIPSIVGNKNNLMEFDFNTNNSFAIVYDKLKELLDVFNIKKIDKKVNLIIDECHNLVSSSIFRKDAMNSVDFVANEVLKKNGSVIMMSATYQVMSYEIFDNMLLFLPAQEYRANTKEFNLYVNNSNKDTKEDKIDFLEFTYNILRNKKGIVRLNNIKYTEKLLNSLVANDNKKVIYCNSQEKESYKDEEDNIHYFNEMFDKVVKNEVLPNNDIAFSTSLMDCGTNIKDIENLDNKEDYESFFCISSFNDIDLLNIEQFFNRLRFENKSYNLLVNNYEKEEKEIFYSFLSIIKREYSKLNRNIKYFNMCLEALKFKYNVVSDINNIELDGFYIDSNEDSPFLNESDKMKELRRELESQFEFKDLAGTRNDMNCIFLNDEFKIDYNIKSFFFNCYKQYMHQFLYFQDKLVEELEKIFNINVKINCLDDENLDFYGVGEISNKRVKEILLQVKNDESLINEIKSNNIKNNLIKNVEKTKEFQDVLDLKNLGLDIKESFNFVIVHNDDDINELKSNLVKDSLKNLKNNDILVLKSILEDNNTINNYKNDLKCNYSILKNLIDSKYYKYFKKSSKMGYDLKELVDIIYNSKKMSEVDNYFKDKQYVYYNNSYLKDEKFLAGKAGEEQRIIIKSFFDKYNNKIKRLTLNEKNLKNVVDELNKTFKTNTYNFKNVKKIIEKVFNVNDDIITSLRLK